MGHRRTGYQQIDDGTYSDNRGLIPFQELLQLADFECNFDQTLQPLGSGFSELCCSGGGRDVAFHIHAHRSALTSSSTQSEDDPRTIGKTDNLALVLRD